MKNFRFFSGLLCLLAVCLAAPFVHAASNKPVNGILFTNLANFNKTNNGAEPYDPVVLGPDGCLYATTYTGGTNELGVIFKVTLTGTQTTLHTFSTNIWDGQSPTAALAVGGDGALYGTTSAGGTNGAGTIFKITTNGVFTQLYSFGAVTNSDGTALDGSTPYGGMVLGRDGNFYGTTYAGGASNCGTVFQCTATGTLTTLYSFTGGADGADPFFSTLVEGANGVFYGDTYYGGTNNGYNGGASGNGTIFQITSGGALATLWQFNGTNGLYPFTGLNFGFDGALYGVTLQGGTNNDGVVFRVTTNGLFSLLFQFSGTNGVYPEGPLVAGFNDVQFGVTYQGGQDGYGSVFSITTNGVLTSIYPFTGKTDGANPEAGVIDIAGSLYGTTLYGGKANGFGTVYKLSDSSRPTNTVTFPVPGQRWSNAVITATGVVHDNVGGTEIFYSLNSSGWNLVVPADGTNWMSSLALVAGTNTLQAYATDGFGHVSATNTLKFIYVPGYNTAILTVLTNGMGTVSPNYNNALLLIGTNYSMTAKAVAGSAFTNWTDASSNVVSASATLNFTMAAGLTYEANFVDVTPPTITITNPVSGARWTNTSIYVIGKDGDNVAVSNVFYSINSSGWTNASFFNNNSNWYALVNLTAGTNTISAYGVDTSGNISHTNSVLLDQIPGATLTVVFNGDGTLTPNYSNALLAIGSTYTMKALGNNGYTFYYWKSGATMVTNASLTFVMATNLTNTANFQDTEVPIVEVTAPLSNQKFSNSVINCTGFAYDNSLVVGGVMCQLNGGGWFPAISTSGSFYTWECTNDFLVNIGANTFEAYSYDDSGNISKTNVVKFTGVTPPQWAPSTFSNLMVQATGQTNSYDLSFATNTFTRMTFFSAGDSGAGMYTYQKTGTNISSVQLTYTATPDLTNDNNPQAMVLTYNSLTNGVFTNSTTTDWGTFIMAPALPWPPKSFSGHNITNTPYLSTSATNLFKFISAASVTIVTNGVTNSTANYAVIRPSPPEALFTITNDDFVQYLQLFFTAGTKGWYQSSTYDTGGVFQTNESGTFNMR